MSRRVFLLLALVSLALLAVAAEPWTLTGGGFAGAVAQHLRSAYGLDLTIRGRSTFALLPVPRIKLENVALAADGVAAEGGTLRGELRLWPLLRGRVDLSRIALSESRIVLASDPAQLADKAFAAGLRGRLDEMPSLRRLVVTNTSVSWPQGSLGDVDLVLSRPGGGERLEAAGSLEWRGERVEIAQSSFAPALASDLSGPFTLEFAAPGAQFSLTGEVGGAAEPRIAGRGTVALRSPRDFSLWSGIEFPLGSLARSVFVQGAFTADRRRLTWPSVSLSLGPDLLEGTLSVRLDGPRPLVTGTLAANQLDLSDFFLPFMQARTASGLWSSEDVSVRAATGGDLDLRLSAAEATIGRLKLADMAASVLVRPGRIEASLGRAGLNKGIVKARLTLVDLTEGADLKAHGTFDGVEMATFLADLGQARWLTGLAQGQFNLETSGSTVVDLVRQSHGRAAITVRQGELVGIGLNDALRRVEKRPLLASTEWKGGRTPFETAQVNLNVGAGVGEITEGSLLAPTLRTALQGRVSLVERAVAIRALVDPTAPSPLPSPLMTLDVVGGWDDVAIVPDVKSLIERSGAAQRLLPSQIIPRSPPVANAQ